VKPSFFSANFTQRSNPTLTGSITGSQELREENDALRKELQARKCGV